MSENISTTLPNPKPRDHQVLRSHWYPYYAGYSAAFVEAMLKKLHLPGDAKVLDPWNGSGTTTAACQSVGFSALGLDLNPAMVVIGRARLLKDDALGSLNALLAQVIADAKRRSDVEHPDAENDPLNCWFERPTAARIRSIELSLQNLLCDDPHSPTIAKKVACLSRLACFFYVLFFRVVREIAGDALKTRNPTWQRASLPRGEKLRASWRSIENQAMLELGKMTDAFALSARDEVDCEVTLGSSESIDLPDQSISAVIGSPPYLTRIDYAVFTRAELAFLGIRAGEDFNHIRGSLLGGARNSIADASKPLSDCATQMANAIANHESKASSTYYLSYYSRFLAGYERSMQNVARVCKGDGEIVLVVQDSMYKEIHLDLAALSAEMLGKSGFEVVDREDFSCTNSLRKMNSAARRNAGAWRATESVLRFRRS